MAATQKPPPLPPTVPTVGGSPAAPPLLPAEGWHVGAPGGGQEEGVNPEGVKPPEGGVSGPQKAESALLDSESESESDGGEAAGTRPVANESDAGEAATSEVARFVFLSFLFFLSHPIRHTSHWSHVYTGRVPTYDRDPFFFKGGATGGKQPAQQQPAGQHAATGGKAPVEQQPAGQHSATGGKEPAQQQLAEQHAATGGKQPAGMALSTDAESEGVSEVASEVASEIASDDGSEDDGASVSDVFGDDFGDGSEVGGSELGGSELGDSEVESETGEATEESSRI